MSHYELDIDKVITTVCGGCPLVQTKYYHDSPPEAWCPNDGVPNLELNEWNEIYCGTRICREG
ncbi:MAG: hypothetical protein GY941_22415 [Planctomycetes bacterium]|nr:hypothetical protein [Planctomycetota bacterium]